jgi:hypothetical protein
MRPRLSAHQGVDTPPALEPEPAADRAHGVDDLENDGQDHAFPILHDAIIDNTHLQLQRSEAPRACSCRTDDAQGFHKVASLGSFFESGRTLVPHDIGARLLYLTLQRGRSATSQPAHSRSALNVHVLSPLGPAVA